MHWDVITVTARPPMTLDVEFADGTRGCVRMEASHLTGVFEKLRDPQLFERVFVDQGVVAWPGEIDLAPDAMYAAIKQHGEWVLS